MKKSMSVNMILKSVHCICLISSLAFPAFQIHAAVPDFPDRYEAEEGNVKFDCEIIVPDSVKEEGVCEMIVDGKIYANSDVAFQEFAAGKEISEVHEYPEYENEPVWKWYRFKDGASLLTGNVSYRTSESNWYTQSGTVKDGDNLEPHVQLEFASAESCIEELKVLLAKLDVPSDIFQFGWYSLNREQLKQLEQEQIDSGDLEEEYRKPEWTKEDEVYVLYGFHLEDGIPVFDEGMGLTQKYATDEAINAPLLAKYSARGLEALRIGSNFLYNLKKTDKELELLEFEDIAKVVKEKYNNLLGEETYCVEMAKFFIMVRKNENQKLAAEPIWRFSIDGGKDWKLVTLVNASTGKEIYIQ